MLILVLLGSRTMHLFDPSLCKYESLTYLDRRHRGGRTRRSTLFFGSLFFFITVGQDDKCNERIEVVTCEKHHHVARALDTISESDQDYRSES